MLPAFDAPGLMPAISGLAPGHAGEPFGIVAGGGVLPRLVAQRARDNGWTPMIVPVGDGWAEDWSGFRARPLKWSQTGDIFPFLHEAGVRHMAFCGTISVRPDYRSMVPSLRTLRLLPQILRIVRGGDDNLLRAVSRAFESRGFTLHAVQDMVPELLAPEGRIAGAPAAADYKALDRAAEAAVRLGALDIGQAIVASADRVIALEGIEGTREMLSRVAELKKRGRIGRNERTVLFKSVKPQQDMRFDLPSIGVETIEQAAAAGVIGIGVSAGASLLIDPQRLVEEAAASGMFIVGIGGAQGNS